MRSGNCKGRHSVYVKALKTRLTSLIAKYCSRSLKGYPSRKRQSEKEWGLEALKFKSGVPTYHRSNSSKFM